MATPSTDYRKKTFTGGPFDGYPITHSDRFFLEHTFDFGAGQMAVYVPDDSDGFVFDRIEPKDGFQGNTVEQVF